jgi:dihydroorotate dehydrogenase (NAD+) catalytic subunit
MPVNLQIELASHQKSALLLKNPVLTASGTFGFGIEYTKLAEVPRLGGIICKGITLHRHSPHTSHSLHTSHSPTPAIETPSGLLYPLDGPNPGLQILRKKYAPIWSNWSTPVIVNIIGNTLEDLSELAEDLENIPGVSGLELNPLSADAHTSWQSDPQLFAEAIAAVRYATTLPLIVKLSPAYPDLLPAAYAAIEAGADAISLIHSLPALGVNLSARRLHIPAHSSALSGPALKPLALRLFADLARDLRTTHPHIPLIGIGGIANASDALEFLMLGASAIQVGSISFTNPRAALQIVEGLESFLQQEGLSDIHDLIGVAL